MSELKEVSNDVLFVKLENIEENQKNDRAYFEKELNNLKQMWKDKSGEQDKAIEKLDDNKVSYKEFNPIRAAVLGLISLILVTVFSYLLKGILK